MDRTALSACTLTLAALVATSPAAAQPSSAIAAAQADFQAARAREASARRGWEAATRQANAAEQRASAAAERDVESRRGQAAQLAEIDALIGAQFERLSAASAPHRKLLTELDVLERWYGILEPVSGHLTQRSFGALESEIGALAAEGLIEPGTRRFRSYLELRNAIAHTQRRLGEARSSADTSKAAIRAELAALRTRRERLLQTLAAAGPSEEAAALGWIQASAAAARSGEELLEAEQAVIAAFRRLSEAEGPSGPPLLASVSASGGGQTVYRAEWTRQDGAAAGDAARERDELRRQRAALVDALDQLYEMRRTFHEARLDSAELLAVRGRLYQQATERYGETLMIQAWSNLGFDAGLTVAELLLTGGAATLERKAEELAEEAGRKALQSRAVADRLAHSVTLLKAGPALARQGDEAFALASSLEASLLNHLRKDGESWQQALARSKALAVSILEGNVEARAQELARSGMPLAAARERARSVTSELIDRLNRAETLSRLADQEELYARELRDMLAEFHMPLTRSGGAELVTAIHELGDTLTVKGAATVFQKLVDSPDRSGATTPSNTMGDVLVGDAIEAGINAGAGTVGIWRDTARELGEFSTFRNRLAGTGRKFGPALWKNRTKIGISAVSTLIKSWAAAQTDALVNRSAEHVATLGGELAIGLRDHSYQMLVDRDAQVRQQALIHSLAAVSERLRMLSAGLTLNVVTPPARLREEDRLEFHLTFSAPLLGPPKADLGTVPLVMSKADAEGRQWTALVPVSGVGDGLHTLSVSATDRETPHGALDSDPRTPALPGLIRAQWVGFEGGTDSNHRVPLTVTPSESAYRSPWDEPDPNSPWADFTANSAWSNSSAETIAPPAAASAPLTGEPVGFAWHHSARTLGKDAIVYCGPYPARNTVGVYGTGVYSASSVLCRAAVHAGVISFERGGRFIVRFNAPGPFRSPGSLNNGIESMGVEEEGLSFRVHPAE